MRDYADTPFPQKATTGPIAESNTAVYADGVLWENGATFNAADNEPLSIHEVRRAALKKLKESKEG